MELQWNRSICPYLRRQVWEVQNQEETQEVRLSDGMPDIGQILCAWGQPILRGKEWKHDSIAISGGVMCWVLYAPEDGSEPRCMEAWLPFQGKWNLPDSQREGTIRTDICLRSVDARSLSNRKIMVRASVGVLAEALEEAEAEISMPDSLPEGVQVLRKTYPAVLPREAGERLVDVEEELPIPGGVGKILCCRIYPQLQEENVVGSRAVFRGCCRVHLVYINEEGRICAHRAELPLAQYADLNRDYDKEATVCVMMAASSVEPEISENGIHIRCGLIAQYVVYDRQLLTVAEDMYSPWQSVSPVIQELELPMVLDRTERELDLTPPNVMDAVKMVDCCFEPDQPILFRENGMLHGRMSGNYQMLYYDAQGQLNCACEPWMGQWEMAAGENTEGFVWVASVDPVVKMRVMTVAGERIAMLTGAQMGDKRELAPARPSLILRRTGEHSLWELAKQCGSTVESIMKANQLASEPAPEQILLIPIC